MATARAKGAANVPATAPALNRYPGISAKAYEHPADRAATKALGAIPGLDKVVRQLIELGYERAMFQTNLAASVRLGPAQLPEIWRNWERVTDSLDLGSPAPLYVAQDPRPNAYAIGSKNPYAVITSRLLEITDPDEQIVVLAHEAGHLRSDHTLYRTTLEILLRLGNTAIPLAGIPLMAIRLALMEWFRAAEFTCDRAAALVTGDPTLVCRTLMVLGGGLPSSRLDINAFLMQVAQYEDWEDGPDRLRRFLGQLRLTHAMPVRRASELTKWVTSGDYDRIVRGDYVTRDREPGVSEVSADAVAYYSEQFRSMFASAGESVSTMGRRFTSWVKGE